MSPRGARKQENDMVAGVTAVAPATPEARGGFTYPWQAPPMYNAILTSRMNDLRKLDLLGYVFTSDVAAACRRCMPPLLLLLLPNDAARRMSLPHFFERDSYRIFKGVTHGTIPFVAVPL